MWGMTSTGCSCRLLGDRPTPIAAFAVAPLAAEAGHALASENHAAKAPAHGAHAQCTQPYQNRPGPSSTHSIGCSLFSL